MLSVDEFGTFSIAVFFRHTPRHKIRSNQPQYFLMVQHLLSTSHSSTQPSITKNKVQKTVFHFGWKSKRTILMSPHAARYLTHNGVSPIPGYFPNMSTRHASMPSPLFHSVTHDEIENLRRFFPFSVCCNFQSYKTVVSSLCFSLIFYCLANATDILIWGN